MPATFFWRDVPASPNQGITLAGNGVVIAIAETTFVAGDDWFTDLAWTPTTQGKPAPIVQIVSPSEVRVIEPARAGRGTLIIGAMITNRPETRTELTLIINGQEDLYWLHNLTGYKASANLAGPGTLLGNAATRFLPSDHWFTYSEWIPQYGSTPAPVINVLDEGDIHILEPAGAGNGVLHLGAMITDQPETRSELQNAQRPESDRNTTSNWNREPAASGPESLRCW